MLNVWSWWIVCTLVGVVSLGSLQGCKRAPDPADGLPERIGFNRDVRPILADKCFACHGPDPGQRQADLRLDVAGTRSAENPLAEREGRTPIVPGDTGASELVRRIHSEDPEESRARETAESSL